MSQTRVAAQNATALAIRNGACIIKRVRVRQYAGAAPRLFLQLFNTNAPTVGTTAPEMVIPVPAGNTKMNATVRDVNFTGDSEQFGTGLAIAVTTVHDGAVAPTAGQAPEVIVDWEPLG